MDKTNDKQPRELSPQELQKVAGGTISSTYVCPFCGEVFEGADTLLGDMNIKSHIAKHMIEVNRAGKK